MKIIKLKRLTLFNFKGITKKTVDFDGEDKLIFGANETGKSTLYTSFMWLLTGKDEFDRKDYEIKNTKRIELNSQPHEVEGILDVEGEEIKLKRVYLEKWTKQKGQSQKEFGGHYTDYYYNDVPCQAKEYQTFVDAIIKPTLIKLVTNPLYFNSLGWEDKRRCLLSLAPEILDEDVLNSIATPTNNYSSLISAFNGKKTLEQWKKEIAAKKKILKDAAVGFPHRIDEAKRPMPEVDNWTEIESGIKETKSKIESIETTLSDSSKALAEKQKTINALGQRKFQLETKVSDIRNGYKTNILNKHNEAETAFGQIETKVKNAKEAIIPLQKNIDDRDLNLTAYKKQLTDKEAEVISLREKCNLIIAETFKFDESSCTCPTCKQKLPTDDIENKKNELQTNFNTDKAKRKKSVIEQADQAKVEIKQLQAKIAAEQPNWQDQIAAYNSAIASLSKQLITKVVKPSEQEINAAIDALMLNNGDALNHQDEIKKLDEEIKKEKSLLEIDNSGQEKANEAQRENKKILETKLKELETRFSKKELIETTTKRVAQLESDETVNSQSIADLEKQEFEAESFGRAKMDILEKRVNGMFKYVKFRLFDKQVNGADADACVCEYKEVPYPTLNTAAKLLSGLDVLETLSNHFGVKAPVFCDNRESTSWIPEVTTQVISLVVSPEDKNLRIGNNQLEPITKSSQLELI